ncbi:hypothetical protein LINPERPRIM_LOCUS37646, partial [Linum perenne]
KESKDISGSLFLTYNNYYFPSCSSFIIDILVSRGDVDEKLKLA